MNYCEYMNRKTNEYYRLIKKRDKMKTNGLDTNEMNKRIAALDSLLGHYNDNMDEAEKFDLPRVSTFRFGIVDVQEKNGKYRKRNRRIGKRS